MKRPRILVVGSLVMDMIAVTERAPGPGENVFGKIFRTAPGGKGANQAVQCARLGAEVTLVGQVGEDSFGETLKKTTADAGVDVSHVLCDPSASSGVAQITVEQVGEKAQNRIVVCLGANLTVEERQIQWLKEEIPEYDMILLQFEFPDELNARIAGWAEEAGVPVMVNPAPARTVSPELFKHCTYLSPNEHEAAVLSGIPLRMNSTDICREDLLRIRDKLLGDGVRKLIVTLGENGSLLADREKMIRIPCVAMDQVLDPTAAGDSFVAAFCTGVAAGLDEDKALSFAAHTAAITVSRMGAQPSLPTLAEVRSLCRQRGTENQFEELWNKLEKEENI